MKKLWIKFKMLKTNDHGYSQLCDCKVRLNDDRMVDDMLYEIDNFGECDGVSEAFYNYLDKIGISWDNKGDFDTATELVDALNVLRDHFLLKKKNEIQEYMSGLDDLSALLIAILDLQGIKWEIIL